MGMNERGAWLEQAAIFIREYAANNPGYSPVALTEALKRKFLLRHEDAVKITRLAEKELRPVELGLAALELNLTFNCNLTCAYCFIREKKPHERMNVTTAQKAVDLLMERAAFPTVNITLIGGEPLLEYDLIKQIVPYAQDAAQKRGLAVTWAVTTNGTLVNEEILKYFAQNKINMLLSMDGGPETHDRYRRTKNGEGTWHKIACALPLMKMYQPWLGVRMTVSKAAVSKMREDFQQLVNLGVNQFIIAPVQGAERWSEKEITRYGLNLVKIMLDYHALKQKGAPVYIEEFEKDEAESAGWGCRAGRTSLAVAPNGDVAPCSKFLGLHDAAGRCVAGNVHTGIDLRLLEPFHQPLFLQQQNCRRCSRKCAGGCYAVNFEQTGDHFTPSEENCLFWAVCQETKKISGLMRVGL